ncbi:hypothetical protein ACOWNS_05590 [Helicobacter pylori]
MWHERALKVIPAVVFLFCLLEILELVLIINGMNKVEKIESEIRNNLNQLEDTTILLNEYLESIKHFQDKKIKIK